MLICPFFKSMSCHYKMEPLKIVGNRTPRQLSIGDNDPTQRHLYLRL